MPHNRFWFLFGKKLTNEAAPHELQELEQLMKDNPYLSYQSEYIAKIWHTKNNPANTLDEEIGFEAHVNRLKEKGILLPEVETLVYWEKVEQPLPRKKNKRLLVAVSLLCILIGAGFIWQSFSKASLTSMPEKKFSEVSTKSGTKTKLILPDSTIVWLNAGSKLTYNDHFGSTNRNTTLSGEAFFDVKKSTIPFIIHTNKIQIKVLGTAFNVRSYDNEKTTETSLVRGRVEITLDKRPGERFILRPNEKLVVSNEARAKENKPFLPAVPLVALNELQRGEDNSLVETSWMENKLMFRNESFEDLSKRMERWYGVAINFKDELLRQQRFSGTFTNESVQQALEELQMTTRFHFKIKQDSVVITK